LPLRGTEVRGRGLADRAASYKPSENVHEVFPG
jgi:hypothetical protein